VGGPAGGGENAALLKVLPSPSRKAPAVLRGSRLAAGRGWYRQQRKSHPLRLPAGAERVRHHPATLIPFLQPSPTSDLPADRHYCRKACRPLKSLQRIEGCILTDCCHLRSFRIWFLSCCYSNGASFGARDEARGGFLICKNSPATPKQVLPNVCS
jgi:hypothetical protein